MPELRRKRALSDGPLAILSDSKASLSVLPERTLLRLRVQMKSAGLASAALPDLLPDQPLCATDGDPYALWTAPDTWLLISPSMTVGKLLQLVSLPLKDILHASTNLSDALLILRLQGPGSRNLLSSGCGLNFSDQAFPAGHCSRTRFASFPLLIHKPDDTDCFELYVDRSYAAALWNWLVG